MLRALLHGKLGGFGLDQAFPEDVGADDDEEMTTRDLAAAANVAALARDEDSLSATVFSRIAYLPAQIVWDLLDAACELHHGEAIPRLDQGFSPSFWTRFPAHVADGGRYSEPDIVLHAGSDAVVVEVKWQGEHGAHQCVRQLRAVATRWPGSRLWMVLVGRRLRENPRMRDLVQSIVGCVSADAPVSGLVTIDWADLAGAVRGLRASPSLAAHVERLVIDLDEALRWRGLREPVELGTLPAPGLGLRSYSTLLPGDASLSWPPLSQVGLARSSARILSRW